MPQTIAAVLAAKALIAKSCAAALVVGAAGVAYIAVPENAADELGSVSVEYAPGEREPIAFATDRTGESEVQIPARYQPGPEGISDGGTSPGDNRDSWNETENSPPATTAEDSSDSEDAGSDEPNKVDSGKEDSSENVPDKEAEVDKTAPALEILHPVDGSHHEQKVLVFEGKTEPGAKVFAGRYQANVDAKGNWRIELVLTPGANGAEFKAIDAAGNKSYDKVTVWFDVSETEKPVDRPTDEQPEEPKSDDHEDETDLEVEFHANQKYGFCDAENPYEIMWGTAKPNTEVHVTSPYGSGVAQVSAKGHWEIKLYFPEAPKNLAFTINVAAANGSKSFSYTAWAPVEEPVEVPVEEPVEVPAEEPETGSENPAGAGEDT